MILENFILKCPYCNQESSILLEVDRLSVFAAIRTCPDCNCECAVHVEIKPKVIARKIEGEQ